MQKSLQTHHKTPLHPLQSPTTVTAPEAENIILALKTGARIEVHTSENLTPTFTVEGRTYKLFKRTSGPSAAWNVVFEFNGKRWPKSLETNVTAAAIERAKEFISTVRGAQAVEVEDNQPSFSVDGRAYKLFKRATGRDAAWNVLFEYGGKRWCKSLETNAAAVAIDRAKGFIRKVRGAKWEDVDKMMARRTASTVGEVQVVYKKLSKIGEATTRNNVWAFGKIIKAVLGVSKAKLDEVSLTEINGKLVERFQDSEVQRYRDQASKDKAGQLIAEAQALLSSRSLVIQARSLFVAKGGWVAKYEEGGLKIPACVQEFMTCDLRGKGTKGEYRQADDALIAKTFAEVEKFKGNDDALYLAFWLACGAGLRKSEIARARWEHIVMRDGRPWYCGGIGKNRNTIDVPIQSRAWAALASFQKETGRMLALSVVEAEGEKPSEEFARRLGWWMTSLGWKTEKKLHELRAYVGSMIYAENSVAAVKFMRHDSVKTTEKFYVRYGKVKTPDVL